MNVLISFFLVWLCFTIIILANWIVIKQCKIKDDFKLIIESVCTLYSWTLKKQMRNHFGKLNDNYDKNKV